VYARGAQKGLQPRPFLSGTRRQRAVDTVSHHEANTKRWFVRVPLRTLDDLERREHEALTAERDAVCAISALLRELAVRVPDESRLIRDFAD
jgi:hypothetical protein